MTTIWIKYEVFPDITEIPYNNYTDVQNTVCKKMFICDPTFWNRPVVGKGHLQDNNERSWEKLMKIKINYPIWRHLVLFDVMGHIKFPVQDECPVWCLFYCNISAR